MVTDALLVAVVAGLVVLWIVKGPDLPEWLRGDGGADGGSNVGGDGGAV